MTRITLKRARARDPLVVAQEIITDLRRDNAALTRMLYVTLGASRRPPKPASDSFLTRSIGCLIGRHRWIDIRPDEGSFRRKICTFCAKIRIVEYSQDEDDLPTGASAPRRGGISSYPEHAPNGPGLGDPIGGPTAASIRAEAEYDRLAARRAWPAPPQPIPGGNVYDEVGELIDWRAVMSPPMSPDDPEGGTSRLSRVGSARGDPIEVGPPPPADRVEPRRLLTWGRMGSRLLRVSLGDGRRPPDEIIVRRD